MVKARLCKKFAANPSEVSNMNIFSIFFFIISVGSLYICYLTIICKLYLFCKVTLFVYFDILVHIKWNCKQQLNGICVRFRFILKVIHAVVQRIVTPVLCCQNSNSNRNYIPLSHKFHQNYKKLFNYGRSYILMLLLYNFTKTLNFIMY